MATKRTKYEILVTGATGFLGKVLIAKMVKHFDRNTILCLVYDKNTLFEKRGLTVLKKLGVSYKKVNLVTGKGLQNLPKNPKIIFHLAAQTDTASPRHEVNDQGVINFYNAIKGHLTNTHFVYIGTMVEVVGRPNCSEPINEDSRDYPTNRYTRTKLAGERFLMEKCSEEPFRLTILRPNTIYGESVRENSLFDMLKKMIAKNSIITRINWPGKSALVNIEDVVTVVIAAGKRPPVPGRPEKYLIYSENLSISEISKLMHKAMGKEYKPISLPVFFWRGLSFVRRFIPLLEKILNPYLYNYFWRLGIIIDDVVWCRTNKIKQLVPNWHPRKLKEVITQVT